MAKAYASLSVTEAVRGRLELAKKAVQKADGILEEITNKAEARKAEAEEAKRIKKEQEGDSETDAVSIKEEESDEEDRNSIAVNRKGTIPSLEEQKAMEEGYKGKGKAKSETSSYELFTLAQKEEIVAMCTAVKEFLEKGKGTLHRISSSPCIFLSSSSSHFINSSSHSQSHPMLESRVWRNQGRW